MNSREREVSKIYHSSWILPILDFVNDAKLNYDTIKVWKRVWILGARSENGCRKWNILVWNWVRILGTGRHTPTKSSEEYPPGSGLKSGMFFKETTGAYKRICLFNSKWIVEKEKYPKYIIGAEFLSILEFVIDAKLDYDTTKVWKWVWILASRSENGCGKWNILFWNWVRIWGTGGTPRIPRKRDARREENSRLQAGGRLI